MDEFYTRILREFLSENWGAFTSHCTNYDIDPEAIDDELLKIGERDCG